MINKKLLFLCIAFYCFILLDCNSDNQKICQVFFIIKHANGFNVVVETVPTSFERKKLVDSASIRSNSDTVVFTLNYAEERLFRIRIKGFRRSINFINDNEEIYINADILTPDKYFFSGSPASSNIAKFEKDQTELARASRYYSILMMSDSTHGSEDARNKFDSIQQVIRKRRNDFADTVSSPAAFLYVYNTLDFGREHQALKSFIVRAAQRFPKHSVIKKLKKETLDYVEILEKELQIGDILPAIELPDTGNIVHSIEELKGRYFLINFWSSWCPQCFNSLQRQKEALKSLLPAKFEIVSIALDSEKDAWKDIISKYEYNWLHLIDTAMWQGSAAKTFKIDSIPFNFLVDPTGRIINKAIKPDSLLQIVKAAIK